MAAAPVQTPTTLLQLLSQLEDAACEDERQIQSLREISIDLQSRADIALEQLHQFRASFAENEESRDQLRRDVMNGKRQPNQTQDAAENHRKENMELQRNLSEVSKERDTLSQSNTQLRESLRSADTERISMKRQCEEEVAELSNNLREVEKSRLEVRRELQELQTRRSGEEPLNQMAAVSELHLEIAEAVAQAMKIERDNQPMAPYVQPPPFRPRGGYGRGQNGDQTIGYNDNRCHRCGQSDHWIRDCPNMGQRRSSPNPNPNPYRGQGPQRGGPPGRGRGRGMPPRTHTRCQLPPWQRL